MQRCPETVILKALATDMLHMSQIDVAILDFSKAFDTVPHVGLLRKLEHYGIDSKILLWITNFLNNLKQCVVVDVDKHCPVKIRVCFRYRHLRFSC